MKWINLLVCVFFLLPGCGEFDDEFHDDFIKEALQGEVISPEKVDKNTIDDEVPIMNIPKARVTIKLFWKQGYSSKKDSDSGVEGTKVDLDLHLIKKHSLEAPKYGYKPEEGVMFTSQAYYGGIAFDPYDLDPYYYEEYFRHDDCSFGDTGGESVDVHVKDSSINWNAEFLFDNQFGGDNFRKPEVIVFGRPDNPVFEDQYLIVVNYITCSSTYYEDDRDTCDPEYDGEDQAYEVDVRMDIFVDGKIVPRPERNWRPADNFSDKSKNFKIHPGEIKVVGVIKWDSRIVDNSMNGGILSDAIVTDIDMPEYGIETNASEYKTCLFKYAYNYLVPIWDEEAYYEMVYSPQNPYDDNSPKNGECY